MYQNSSILGRPIRGFSLIELLVVMGIVSILVGILMPTLSAARENARAVVCGNNMRQIGIGFALAIDDSPGHRYPARQINTALYDPEHVANGFTQSWINTTSEYFSVAIETLAKCPSDYSPFWTEETPGCAGMFRQVSYGVNPYASLSGGIVNEPQHQFVTDMHEIKRPSSFIGLGELPQSSPRFAVADYINTPGLVAEAILDDDPSERVTDEAFEVAIGANLRDNQSPNWLFLDGHVERLGRPDVISLPEAVGSSDPLADHYGDYPWVVNLLHPVVAR